MRPAPAPPSCAAAAAASAAAKGGGTRRGRRQPASLYGHWGRCCWRGTVRAQGLGEPPTLRALVAPQRRQQLLRSVLQRLHVAAHLLGRPARLVGAGGADDCVAYGGQQGATHAAAIGTPRWCSWAWRWGGRGGQASRTPAGPGLGSAAVGACRALCCTMSAAACAATGSSAPTLAPAPATAAGWVVGRRCQAPKVPLPGSQGVVRGAHVGRGGLRGSSHVLGRKRRCKERLSRDGGRL
jgi:hypothetical protein